MSADWLDLRRELSVWPYNLRSVSIHLHFVKNTETEPDPSSFERPFKNSWPLFYSLSKQYYGLPYRPQTSPQACYVFIRQYNWLTFLTFYQRSFLMHTNLICIFCINRSVPRRVCGSWPWRYENHRWPTITGRFTREYNSRHSYTFPQASNNIFFV